MVRRKMTVRRAEIADCPGLAQVAEQCFSHPLKETDFRSMRADANYLLLVSGEEVVTGYGLFTLLGSEAEVYSIAVAPACRRHGTGRALLTAGLRMAKEAGAQRMYLEVRQSNSPAIGLYTALGFTGLGKRKNYYSDPREDAVIMAADI